MSSCTRCGMSLSTNEGHDCDGRLIDVAYEVLVGKEYGKPIRVFTLSFEAGVPETAIVTWANSKSDLKVEDGMVVLIPSEQEAPEEDGSGALTPIFLLSRVERLAQELGRCEVQIAFLQDQLEKANEEILKLRGQS